MLIVILGAIDFITGLILMFGTGIKLPLVLLIGVGGILIAKSAIGFWKNFASWIDLLSGAVFILLAFFHIHWIICIAFGILLIQKGIFSLIK